MRGNAHGELLGIQVHMQLSSRAHRSLHSKCLSLYSPSISSTERSSGCVGVFNLLALGIVDTGKGIGNRCYERSYSVLVGCGELWI